MALALVVSAACIVSFLLGLMLGNVIGEETVRAAWRRAERDCKPTAPAKKVP